MKVVSSVVAGLVALFGIACVIVGVGLSFYFKSLVRAKVNKEVIIKNGSEAYKNWKSPPTPVYLQFYLFDVKNAYEIINNGDKPIVRQKGPFTYREIRDKEAVVFDNGNGTVSYVQPKFYIFERNMSCASENENVTTPNVPLIFAASKIHELMNSISKSFIKTLIEGAIKGFFEFVSTEDEPMFRTLPVHKVLWGYKEPWLERYDELRNKIFNWTHLTLPYIDDSFGLFSQPGNGSADGNYTVYTGQTNITLLNVIQTWNHKTHLTYWNTTYCNMINGTDGSQYHPFITQKEVLQLFSSDICRSLHVEYEKDTRIENIELYRFIAPKSLFANHFENPDNEGFCVPKCLGSGVLNIASCKQGAPIVASQPHFYQAADVYINAINGMAPNKEEHETYLEIEPITGVGMHLSKKLQINVLLDSVEELPITKYFNQTIFPILWINESATVDHLSAQKFKHQVYSPIQLTLIIQYSLIGFGTFFCFCVVIFAIISFQRRKQLAVNVQEPETSDHKGLLDHADT